MYCKHCGAQINDNAVVCVKCGCAVSDSFNATRAFDKNISEKDWLITAVLCLFLGWMGAHRFYVGKIGTAILMILTCGCVGIWTFIDLVFIVAEKFTDDNGKVIKNLRNY